MHRGQKIKISVANFIILFGIIYLLPITSVYQKIPKKVQKFLPKEKINLGLDLQGGMHIVLGVDLSNFKSEDERRVAILQALEVIRNRVDQFGVTEPSIQLQGKERIVIQLPGVKDPNRAIDLIGKVAKLEFKLLGDEAKKREIIAKIDETLPAEDNLSKKLFSLKRWESQLVVREKEGPLVNNLLKQIGIEERYEILLGKLEEEEIEINGVTKREMVSCLYLLEKEAKITGGELKTAFWASGSNPVDLSTYNKPVVHLEFNFKGTKKFARVTKENKGKQLAICLDDKVYSAPVINEEIPHGQAQISGNFTEQEALDLSIVLRAGALPAPVKVLQEETIGPSLGQDSIKDGVFSSIIGCIFVIIFMTLYYRLSGVIAIAAIFVNIIFVLVGLIMLKASLTLPGIAGIALTFGMAVDANVLIFERIREEIKKGNTALACISKGYSSAFLTIFDSNLTTIIAAIILFEFGTGPIKGFAVTLILGLIISMLTAIIGTRIIFDVIIQRKTTRISI